MPKAEAGSAKALSNAMKARGLQKLKFYCEMCKKQCRDDNAFKVISKGDIFSIYKKRGVMFPIYKKISIYP